MLWLKSRNGSVACEGMTKQWNVQIQFRQDQSDSRSLHVDGKTSAQLLAT